MVIEGGIIYTDLKGQALNKPVTIPGLHTQLMKNNQKQWVLFNFKDNNSLVVKPAMVAYGVYDNNIWGFTGNKQVTVSPDDVLTMTDYGGGGGGSGDMKIANYGGSDPNTVRRADNALKLDGKTPNELSINMDLLWENASSTSAFATQTVQLKFPAENYDIILLKYRTTAVLEQINSFLASIGAENYFQIGALTTYTRSINIRGTEVIFSGGQIVQNGQVVNDDSAAVPTQIYGIK